MKRNPKHSLSLSDYHSWLVIQFSDENKTKIIRLTFGSRNVRTLLNNDQRPVQRTALLAGILKRYNIDITVPHETRLPGELHLEEMRAGYTYY